MNAVEIKDLTKIYRLYPSRRAMLREALSFFRRKYHSDFYALNRVSLDIPRGQTVGIIGRNGSGKSTLLQILCSVVRPSAGAVRTEGRISALLELGAGFNPEFTGRENAYMNGALMGFSKKEMDARFPAIEEFADIGAFIGQPVKIYSSGMYVRLAFATAVNVDPDILVVDEALAVGDTRFQLKCIEKMKAFQRSGKTVIFVTHDLTSVRYFCERAVWIHDGQVKLDGDVTTVTNAYSDFMKPGTPVNGEAVTPVKPGKGVLTIHSVKVTDARSMESGSLELGRPFSVKVTYTLHEDVPDILGGVALFTKDSVRVCALNTGVDRFPLPVKKGDYELSIHYPDPCLLPGTYLIDAGFYEGSATVILDYRSRASSFYVAGTPEEKSEGICLLDHEWNVSTV